MIPVAADQQPSPTITGLDPWCSGDHRPEASNLPAVLFCVDLIG
jgi:hypothetical protein